MRETMEKIDMLKIKSRSRFVYEAKLEVKHQGVSNITINQKEVRCMSRKKHQRESK
jgi:hypothetical protein